MHRFQRLRSRCGAVVVCLLPLLALLVFCAARAAIASDLEEGKVGRVVEVRPGDHICIIGNTLADRMQHDGWLETYLYTRFPTYDLIFRNLGYAADELTTRLR